jgi:hypothetical protein
MVDAAISSTVVAGTRFTATLKSPLDFGMAALEPSELDQAGSQLPSTGVIDTVLTTALDSSTAQHGMAVEATVSRPVFSHLSRGQSPRWNCRPGAGIAPLASERKACVHVHQH